MKTNKVHFFFLIVESVICIAGGIHTLVSYFQIINDKTTSFPPYACVISLIPYAIAFCAVGIIWLMAYLFFKIKRKKAIC